MAGNKVMAFYAFSLGKLHLYKAVALANTQEMVPTLEHLTA